MLLPLRWLLYGTAGPAPVAETGVGGKRRGIRYRKPPRIDSKPPGHITWTDAMVPTQYELEQRKLKEQISEEDELLAVMSALL